MKLRRKPRHRALKLHAGGSNSTRCPKAEDADKEGECGDRECIVCRSCGHLGSPLLSGGQTSLSCTISFPDCAALPSTDLALSRARVHESDRSFLCPRKAVFPKRHGQQACP